MLLLDYAAREEQVRVHLAGHHLASSRCLPQVWLRGGVLDLFAAHHFRVHPWNYLCCLYHHQVIVLFFLFCCDPIKKKFLIV
ncbi:hypothetical protein OIU84_018214 [Salix udensis]|uniref:Uncharacterized protein n=1 Tax=Salix udensis TaxID=889485 RepID=A0AAD6L3M1_9ROSI|nr:hypothetical protein OIU84_018214 [Salix udensis]